MSEELISGIGFKGMSPATGDESLSSNQAAYARDVDLYRGVIRPTKSDVAFSGTVHNFDADQTQPPTRIFALPGSDTGSL